MNFYIVLHFVNTFVWDCSVLTQYSYYPYFYCLWPMPSLRDCAIVGYSSPTGQQGKYDIFKYYYNCLIKITGSSCYLLFCFNAWYFYTTKYRNTLPSNYFVVLGAPFWTIGLFERLADCQCIFHRTIILLSEYHNT